METPETPPPPVAEAAPRIKVTAGNTLADLKPLAAKVLEDNQWHRFAEFLGPVGDHIGPERATRFYKATGASNTRPVTERVLSGRRRGTYNVLNQMVGSGFVECKNPEDDCNKREYRLLRPYPGEQKPKEPRKRERFRPQVDEDGAEILRFLDDMQKKFLERFPGSVAEQADFRSLCRALERIVLLNFGKEKVPDLVKSDLLFPSPGCESPDMAEIETKE